jgi:hypothetical protein
LVLFFHISQLCEIFLCRYHAEQIAFFSNEKCI